jgi:hypothetical protein
VTANQKDKDFFVKSFEKITDEKSGKKGNL